MDLDERSEFPSCKAVATKIGFGGDSRGPRASVDESDLTEMVAGLQRPNGSDATQGDACGSTVDDEEADAILADVGDDRTRRKSAFSHRGSQSLTVAGRQLCK